MPEPERDHRPILFILRLWQEFLGQELWEWRGAIRELSTGDVRYFRQWTELQEIIEEMANAQRAIGRPPLPTDESDADEFDADGPSVSTHLF